KARSTCASSIGKSRLRLIHKLKADARSETLHRARPVRGARSPARIDCCRYGMSVPGVGADDLILRGALGGEEAGVADQGDDLLHRRLVHVVGGGVHVFL